jgi:DNA-binding MarR family transcriptional regulator
MGLRPTRSHRGVRLTASGLTILDKVAALTEGREHMLLSGFAPEERADLVGYLDRLLDNFTRVAGLDLADADAAQHGRRTR